MPEAPRIKHIEDIAPLPAGGVGYRLVRRELGIRAFGTNAFTADAGVQLIEEHDETGSGAGGHEELYVVLTGLIAVNLLIQDATRTYAMLGLLLVLLGVPVYYGWRRMAA